MTYSGNHPLPANFYNVGTDLVSPNLTTLWNNSGDAAKLIASNQTGSQGILEKTYGPGSSMVNVIQGAITSDKFILGIVYTHETTYDSVWFLKNSTVKLRVVFRYPAISFTVDQRLSNNTQIGTIGRWNGTAFPTPGLSPGQQITAQYTPEVLRGSQDMYSNEKYNTWKKSTTAISDVTNHHNFYIDASYTGVTLTSQFKPAYSGITINNLLENTAVTGGNVEFKDPWFIDYSDPGYGNQKKKQGITAPFISRTSPFSPDFSTSYGGNTYKGVFLNQLISTGNYYSVRTPLTQDIYLSQTGKTHKFYFQNWSGINASFQNTNVLETGIVFTNNNASASAVLKGTQLSNTASAFTNSSQRKLVRTKDNWLHQVYESMGHVWIEHSSKNGSTWILGNDGKPLDNGGGKCPSIDWDYNRNYPNNSDYYSLVAVFQERYGIAYRIQYAVFKCTSGSYVRQVPSTSLPLYTEPDGGDQYASVNANPNISWGDGNRFALTFERKSTVGSMQPGIYWIFGTMFDSGLEPLPAYPCSPVKITGTTASSTNATVSLNKASNDISSIEVAYQAGTSAPANITRVSLYCDFVGNAWNPSQVSSSVISYQTGYLNTKPSLIQMPNGSVRVSWIRNLYGSSNDPINTNVVYWNSTTPSVYNYSGNGVNSVSLNIKDDNTNTYFAYAQNTNNTTWQNFASNNTSTVTLNTTGRDIQLSNGSSSSNMYASSYYSSSLPYYFLTSNSLGSLAKSAGEEFTYGRGVILGKDDIEFSYSIKSLTVDNTPVKFAEIPENEVQTGDTLILTRGIEPLGIDSLNTLLISEPFKIQEGTTVSFSEGGGFTRNEGSADTSKVQQTGDYINCLVELVEEGTNKSLGVIKQNQFISGDKKESGLSFSNVKMNNSEEKPVRLKITLTTNITGVQGMLVNEYNTVNDEMLQKLAAQDIALQEEGVIKNYALEQNYPNPFNPSTTINYQLPKDGMVTLKIYDAIGREVKTLVDEFKQKGKYSINFNASELASGVYFYRINVNGFSVSKKLMLLK